MVDLSDTSNYFAAGGTRARTRRVAFAKCLDGSSERGISMLSLTPRILLAPGGWSPCPVAAHERSSGEQGLVFESAARTRCPVQGSSRVLSLL